MDGQTQQAEQVAVTVRGQGEARGIGQLALRRLDTLTRVRRAGRTAAILAGLALASLPLPPIHWLLVPGFLLAAIVTFAVRMQTEVLADGAIACVKCMKPFEVEPQPPTWPLELTCVHCRASLRVAPDLAGR